MRNTPARLAFLASFAMVSLSLRSTAQTRGGAPERVAWPLVDFVVLGDSTHGIQLIASPNLNSVQGRQHIENMTLTLEPIATRRWAASVMHVVDSVARLKREDRNPFLTVPLQANLGRAGLTVSLNGQGSRDSPFLFAVAGSPGKGWSAYASVADIRELLTAIDATAQGSAFDSVPSATDSDLVFLACQLDQEPKPRDREILHYPLSAESRRQQGRVLAQFIIDSSGVTRPESFRLLLSDGDAFSDAVRGTVLHTAFVPGRRQGHAVSTLVWQWFAFRMRE